MPVMFLMDGCSGRFIVLVRSFVGAISATLLCNLALRFVIPTTMTSLLRQGYGGQAADFSPITLAITDDRAAALPRPHVDEISPGKNTILHHPNASFTSRAE